MSAVVSQQLVLDLQPHTAFGREDFLSAPCNDAALAWIERWPDWPACGVAIWGSPGSGKSHLAQVWRALSGAIEVAPAALADMDPRAVLAQSRAVIIEDADGPLGAAAERGLFHLYNLCREQSGGLLLTGREAPARWPTKLPDLASRLSALPAVAIGHPDDALIEAVLVKLFADRQLAVGAEVIRFLKARMERSFAAARLTVDALDKRALASQRPITIPVAREVMAEVEHG